MKSLIFFAETGGDEVQRQQRGEELCEGHVVAIGSCGSNICASILPSKGCAISDPTQMLLEGGKICNVRAFCSLMIRFRTHRTEGYTLGTKIRNQCVRVWVVVA